MNNVEIKKQGLRNKTKVLKKSLKQLHPVQLSIIFLKYHTGKKRKSGLIYKQFITGIYR
jgi:hypothetical protein